MTSRQGLVYLKVVFYERFGVKEPLKEDLSRRHSNLANVDKPDVRCFIYNCKCFKPKYAAHRNKQDNDDNNNSKKEKITANVGTKSRD